MKRLIFRLARSRFARFVIGWSFAHMSFLIPSERLYETKTLVAFYHPTPSYRVHILIVPKRSISSLLALTPADYDFTADVFSAAQWLIRQLQLANYRLITNGGAYQEVPILHFHLIAD